MLMLILEHSTLLVIKQDSNQSSLLFPGYENLNSRGQVINPADNNGQSDSFVPPTNQYGFTDTVNFSDYTFTADNLPAFRYYRIKLLLTGDDQVYVPRVKVESYGISIVWNIIIFKDMLISQEILKQILVN